MTNTIELQDFLKVEIRTGTILSVRPNIGARKPAYVMEIAFGPEMGIRTTSAQITEKYAIDELVGRQVVAVTNFPPLHIAGVKSEVLVLGALENDGVVLLKPGVEVANGTRIA